MTLTEKEALKLALEALERIDLWLKARYSGIGLVGVELDAITAIKEALSSPNGEAQPEQRSVSEHLEPVDAVLLDDMVEGTHPSYGRGLFTTDNCVKKLYTAPPQRDSSATPRTWVGLTGEEVKDIVWNLPYEPTQEHIRAIEAKLKEKNND